MNEYLTDTVLWKPALKSEDGKVLIDDYGKPKYADLVPAKARVEETRRQVRDKTGAIVTSQSTVIVKEPFGLDDKVLFEDGREFSIISISLIKDLAGALTHREVYL